MYLSSLRTHREILMSAGKYTLISPQIAKVRLAGVLALALIQGNAFADWEFLGTSNGNGFFIDQKTLTTTGELKRAWALFDFPQPITDSGPAFQSVKSQEEYDCAQQLTKSLYIIYYSGPMGSGSAVRTETGDGKWKPAPPNSPGQLLLRTACQSGSNVAGKAAAPANNSPTRTVALPQPPSKTERSFIPVFGGWITGQMVSTTNGEELLYEIEASRGTGGMWAANKSTGEVFTGTYSAWANNGGYSFGSISGSGGSSRGTTNVQIYTPPSSANGKGFLKGGRGTVIEVFLDIQPGLRPTGAGEGIDNKNQRYRLTF